MSTPLSRNGHNSKDLDDVVFLKPAIVCDLDGTIRYPKGDAEYINDPDDIAFYDGVLEALWRYREKGYAILGATNQGGVAHGHLTPGDWSAQCRRMGALAEQECERGWPFHRVRACFYMASGDHDQYGHRSLCRKPRYGQLAVLEQEAREQGVVIDWDESVMIGDREEDMACAEAAGITFWHAEDWRAEVQETILGEER